VKRANDIRSRWYKELDRMFDQYDFLVLPTAQVFPFPKTTHWPKQINGRDMDTYHRWMEAVIPGSLGGIPVINVPVGFDDEGRPMGMQVMGRFGDDEKVLEFALAYEEITDYLAKRPQLIDRL
jgi:amidase